MRGYLALGAAFVACPCHLPFTLGVLGSIAGGSLAGGLASGLSTFIYVAAAVTFLASLRLAFHWLLPRQGAECCDVAAEPGGVSSTHSNPQVVREEPW
ncbi:MAG: hypothetical protein ACE5IZ_05750 [Dehalococcoidia bacterium]